MKTFSRGIHFEKYYKGATEGKSVIEASIPKRIILPLQMNLGCACEPLVKAGDEVAEGQKIADSSKSISAPVHASISGKVVKIERLPNPCGFDVDSIVIEGSGEQEAISSGAVRANRKLEDLSPDEIRRIVREAGIVGLGGAAFPTHVKITPPKEKKIDTIVINGCECEPYITADHRIMLERPKDILYGAMAVARACGAENIIIGVEDNKQDAIEGIKSEIRNLKSEINLKIEIQVLKTKYPQGGEKQLIKAVLDREVPSGGLPLDIGAVVQNVGTCVAIAEAVRSGAPLIKRVVTVAGSGVKEPKNLLVRIGTSFEEVISQCGGLTDDAAKVIMGGPMMGLSFAGLDLPVVKGTSSVLVLNREDARVYEEGSCIRCGRCIKVCPIGLLPNFIADFAKLKDWDKALSYHLLDCIECGCCSYICPSRIHLVQYFKVAKRELNMRKSACR